MNRGNLILPMGRKGLVYCSQNESRTDKMGLDLNAGPVSCGNDVKWKRAILTDTKFGLYADTSSVADGYTHKASRASECTMITLDARGFVLPMAELRTNDIGLASQSSIRCETVPSLLAENET